jgi:hypothetical protein
MIDSRPNGVAVCARQGDKIGNVSRIVEDEQGGVDWALVGGTHLSNGNGAALVPLLDAALEGEAIVVPYDKEIIEEAPEVPLGRPISAEDVDGIAAYYRQRVRSGPPPAG